MATLKSSLRLHDGMSASLRAITGSVNILIGSFEDMQAVSANPIDTAALQAARREIQSAGAHVSQLEEEFNKAGEGAQRYEREVRNASNETNRLHQTLQRAVSIAAVLATLKLGAGLSDSLVQVNARLDLINDGMRTTEELSEMIFQSAQRSRGAYLDTAAAVANLSMQAKDAFSDNTEAVYFAELLNKMFTVSGTDAQGAASVMYNLTQAMASGVLRGQDLNAVMSNTPMILQQVADYMGIPIGQIRELAAEGQLSASIIKEAMFAASAETEAMFATMPMTFGQVWQSIQNQLITMFEPVLMKLNELLNDPSIQAAINGLLTGISYIAQALSWVMDLVMQVANLIAANWSWIQPIVMGIAVAIGLWAAVTIGLAAAKWIATTAQLALNGALLASPLTWIILIIAAVVVAIYQWVKSVGGIKIAWLIAVNAILTAWDWVKIGFYTGVYWVMDMLGRMSLGFKTAGVAIANFMGDMKASVLNILQSMVNGAIDVINFFIKALNKIPGVSIDLVEQVTFGTEAALKNEAAKQARAEALESERAALEESINDRKMKLDLMKQDAREATDLRLQEIELARAELDKPSEEAEEADEWQPVDPADFVFDPSVLESGAPKAGKVGNIDKNVGDIKDSLDISNEELKYLREIAERDVINRFTFADMSFDFTNVQSEPDIDGVVDQFGDWLKEQLVGAAEGVHV